MFNKRRKYPNLFPFTIEEPTDYIFTSMDSFTLDLLGYRNALPVLTIVKSEQAKESQPSKPSETSSIECASSINIEENYLESEREKPKKYYSNKRLKTTHELPGLPPDHNYTSIAGPGPGPGLYIVEFNNELPKNLYVLPQEEEIKPMNENQVDLETVIIIDSDDSDVEENPITGYLSELKNLFQNYKMVDGSKSLIWKNNLFRDLQSCKEFDVFGNIPLHEAIYSNSLTSVIRQALALRIRNISIDIQNQQSLTPFQLAVLYDCQWEILHTLINFKANTSAVDSKGNTVLHLAALYSEVTTLQTILSLVRIDLNATNSKGDTALILCVIKGKLDHCRVLLTVGADPNIGDKRSGRTPLFHAIEANDEEMVQLLLSFNGSTKIRNFLGMSPHEAVFELDYLSENLKNLILKSSRENDIEKFKSIKE